MIFFAFYEPMSEPHGVIPYDTFICLYDHKMHAKNIRTFSVDNKLC